MTIPDGRIEHADSDSERHRARGGVLFFCFTAAAADMVSGSAQPGDLELVAGGRAADIYYDDSDHPVVGIAAHDLAGDVERVTGVKPRVVKWVKWSGKVSHVSETFGNLQVQVKCQSSTLTSDAIISFDDSYRERLLQLNEGQTISFEGRLNDYNQLLGLSLRDGGLK